MLEEKRALDALANEVNWFTPLDWSEQPNGEIALHFQITFASIVLDLLLEYPVLFPETPAYIAPQKYGENLSKHQFGGRGVLCLEYGPDNWHELISGVDLVRSAHDLLLLELAGAVLETAPHIPSRHHSTLGQQLRDKSSRLIVTPEFAKRVELLSDQTKHIVEIGLNFADFTAILAPFQIGENSTERVKDVPSAVYAEWATRKGWLVCDARLSTLPNKLALTELRAALGAIANWPLSDAPENQFHTILTFVPLGRMRAFTFNPYREGAFYEAHVIELADDYTARLPSTPRDKNGTTIAIVGLGSVGSKIAISLGRSGFKNFVLMDDDILLPGNLTRHALSWDGVGVHKVEAVDVELRRIAPGINVKPIKSQVAGQENSQMAAYYLAALAACDLVIDATASPQAFLQLAALCKEKKIPFVWGELFAGGIGALMARSVPGRDQNPLAVRHHIFEVLKSYPLAPFRKVNSYDVMEIAKPLIAWDAEVTSLAAEMTRFAIDALALPSDMQYPVAAYLIGYRHAWIFKEPFFTIPIDCTGDGLADGVEAELLDSDAAELSAFLATIKKSKDGQSNGAA